MPKRYRIKMPDGNSFNFEWDKDAMPTQKDVLSQYELHKKSLQPESEDYLSNLWDKANESFLPEMDFGNRAANWGYSRLVRPIASPVGLATTAATAFGGPIPRALVGLGGALYSATQMPQTFSNFNENPSLETAGDVALTGLGAAGGLGLTKASLNALQPKVFPKILPAIDIPDAPEPKQLLANNPVNPIQLGPDVNAPKITVNSTFPQPPIKAVEKITIPSEQYGLPDVPKLGPNNTGTFGINNVGEMFPTVPSRMQSSTNQRVFDALLPSRTKELINQQQTTNPRFGVVEKLIPQPDKVVTDQFEGLSAKAQAARDAALNNVDEWGRNIVARSGNSILDNGIKTKNPEISKIALEADKTLEAASKSSKPKSAAKSEAPTTSEASNRNVSLYEKLFQSGTKTLEKLGDSGKELARKLNRIRSDSDRLTGDAEANIRKFSDKLSREEKSKFGNYVEGLEPIPNENVQRAVEAYFTEVEKSGIYAENAKLNIVNAKGDKIPFQRVTDKYWARQYPEGYFDGPEGRQSLMNELIKNGVDPKDAQKIVANSAKFGERFIDSQHARQYYRIPGYRVDIDAAFKHLREIYRRSQEAIELGNDDINSPETADLIRKTANPQVATEILEQQLGRTRHDAQAAKFVHAVNSVEAAVSLPFAAIGNFSQRFAPIMKSNMTNFAKALKNTLFDKESVKDSAMRSGALEPVQAVFRAEGGQGLISKLYGLTATEEGNRILSSEVGKLEVLDSFQKLKKNPKNSWAKSRISELLQESPEEVIKQDNLTDVQIKRAQYRMAQVTQGLTDPVDLPINWNKSPYAKLPTFLRRFAFQQTRMMKDAILENPQRNIPVGLGLYALIGEGTADARKGITTIINGMFDSKDNDYIEEIKNAIASRGEDGFFQGLSPGATSFLADRIASNLTNAYALGLVEDALQSAASGQPSSLLEFMTGKAASDAAKIGWGAAQSVIQRDPKKLGRAVTDISPLTRPIGQQLLSSKQEKRMFVPLRPTIKPINR